MSYQIRHNEERQRFETTVDGQLCVCDYRLRGDVMVLTHTGVPEPVAGRGIAAELVRTALGWAEAQGRRVDPACSYVAVYMRRHPETMKLLAT
ncbi:MAG TPA: GNAT family N-acetyltransferase [Burkholderiaceae bacterium]